MFAAAPPQAGVLPANFPSDFIQQHFQQMQAIIIQKDKDLLLAHQRIAELSHSGAAGLPTDQAVKELRAQIGQLNELLLKEKSVNKL